MTNPQPDEKDLARYYQSETYISHSNKSQNIVDRIYKISRIHTLKWKYNLIQKHSIQKPISVLDFGCGTGSFLQQCQQKQMKVAGVEPSPQARRTASNLTNAPVKASLLEVPGPFDVITLWHVLEHVRDLNTTLDDLKSALQINGTVFIAVPNLNSSDAKAYGEHWAAYDVPRHLWHFSRQSMKRLLEQHALKLINILPMRLDAYYVCLLSEKYQRGKNAVANITRGLTQGWKSNSAAEKNHEYSSLIYIARK